MKKNQDFLIYLNKISENWIVDRTRKEWYENNKSITTQFINKSNIIWLIASWNWANIKEKNLNNKKVLCSIYHIDEEKFNKEKESFYLRDKYVNEYHVISNNTKKQLRKITDKKITTLPFWVNQKIWFYIESKDSLREKYKLKKDEFLIGSFQRDSEGSDLQKPKLSKGPDQFVDIVSELNKDKKNINVIITGKRRNFLINELKKRNIKYSYFEMVNFEKLNELYNCLDLYIVSSRYEGGPQSIVECGITKTPIISTDVGIAPEILARESIFDMSNFLNAVPNIEEAYSNSKNLSMEKIFPKYIDMFRGLNES